MKKIDKIVAFQGNSGNSVGDGGGYRVLDSNHQGTGRVKMARDLGERVPWVPRGISCYLQESFCLKAVFENSFTVLRSSTEKPEHEIAPGYSVECCLISPV